MKITSYLGVLIIVLVSTNAFAASLDIPLTKANWQVPYTGYGYVKYERTPQSVVFAPMSSTYANETHATLLLANQFIKTPLKNFRVSVEVTTERQLRTPNPNAWENFWLFFNYTPDKYGKKLTNYFILKTNGVELGRAYEELGQDFLATSTSAKAKIGSKNKITIEKRGQTFKAYVNDKLALNYTGGMNGRKSLYDFLGTIGLYSEDARIRVHSVNVEPL